MSVNKESHNVEVLAKIYFTITNKIGRRREKGRDISCSPQKNWD
jgi:hypothetical protein